MAACCAPRMIGREAAGRAPRNVSACGARVTGVCMHGRHARTLLPRVMRCRWGPRTDRQAPLLEFHTGSAASKLRAAPFACMRGISVRAGVCRCACLSERWCSCMHATPAMTPDCNRTNRHPRESLPVCCSVRCSSVPEAPSHFSASRHTPRRRRGQHANRSPGRPPQLPCHTAPQARCPAEPSGLMAAAPCVSSQRTWQVAAS